MNWGMIWLSWSLGSFVFLFFEMKVLERKYSLGTTFLFHMLVVCVNGGVKNWSFVAKGAESYPQYAMIPLVMNMLFILVCFKDKIGKKLLV